MSHHHFSYNMRKIRGFKLRKHLFKISKWIFRRPTKPNYQRLNMSSSAWKSKPIAKLINWGRSLSTKTKPLCSMKPGAGYMHVGQEPLNDKPASIPKGYLAVYVGRKDGDFQRVLVPVIYFNHPLFGELLREAEEEFGFAQQGGITIPCRYSEFESVKTRIDASGGGRKLMGWRRHS